MRLCLFPFIIDYGLFAVVRYALQRMARQFGYNQGVSPVRISFCSFEKCLVRYSAASSDDFIWGHPTTMVASPASSFS